jgi:predicted enzyme involved in methoxymalonyl-ACP biosynthesis
MNKFIGLGYLLESPKVVKEKNQTIARFIMVIRENTKQKPIYIKCLAVNNIADLFYINRERGNLFSFVGKIVNSELKQSNTGSTFENYVIVEYATLIDRMKRNEKGLGFKDILELFPPEAVIHRRKNNGG